MITTDTADQLDALAIELASAAEPDVALDQRLYDLILEPCQVIQGRTPAAGFKYTLNVTNALQLRAKQWYLKGIMEIGEPNQPFAACGFEFMPQLGFVQGGTSSTGSSIGLAACSAIAKSWALIIRTYVAG